MVRAACMEKIMSKTTTREVRELTEAELNAVSGGISNQRIPTIHPAKIELGSIKLTFA
jgi:bacteriocin-like protein